MSRCRACDAPLSGMQAELCNTCQSISSSGTRDWNDPDFRFEEMEGRRLLNTPQGDIMETLFSRSREK